MSWRAELREQDRVRSFVHRSIGWRYLAISLLPLEQVATDASLLLNAGVWPVGFEAPITRPGAVSNFAPLLEFLVGSARPNSV